MENYYSGSLNAIKLYEVYQTKIERVQQYLNEEIKFVRDQLSPDNMILEMGAGYGRIMKELALHVKSVHGIDISSNTAAFGQQYLKEYANCDLIAADAYQFNNGLKYDAVLCLQNGLSAFKGNASKLVEIAVRSLKKNGMAYFSSYSAKFWEIRLAWFEEQADKGLLGEIDYAKTKNGNIVCKDGFIATTFSRNDMERLGKVSGCRYTIQEVDDSSVFLIIYK